MFDIDKAASNVINAATKQLEVMDVPVSINTQITLIREWISRLLEEAHDPEDFELLEAAQFAHDRLYLSTIGISY
jgi:hypothetical protein